MNGTWTAGDSWRGKKAREQPWAKNTTSRVGLLATERREKTGFTERGQKGLDVY